MSSALIVNPDDPTPPYEQLRGQLADLIEAGRLADGERLPPLRQLAGDLSLAVGTVARTYRELEAAGFVRSRRGAGTRVAFRVPKLSARERQARLAGLAAAYVMKARALGSSDAEITAAVLPNLPEKVHPLAGQLAKLAQRLPPPSVDRQPT